MCRYGGMKELLTVMSVKTRLGSHVTRYRMRQTNSVPELQLQWPHPGAKRNYFPMVGNSEAIQKRGSRRSERDQRSISPHFLHRDFGPGIVSDCAVTRLPSVEKGAR